MLRKKVARSRRPVLLGNLEAAVMRRIWAEGSMDVKAVYRGIGVSRRITLNTVQSTMARLYRKGLLGREKVSHAYVYSARLSQAEFATRLAGDIASTIVGSDIESLFGVIVSMVERGGHGDLEKLQRMIAARRGRRELPR